MCMIAYCRMQAVLSVLPSYARGLCASTGVLSSIGRLQGQGAHHIWGLQRL